HAQVQAAYEEPFDLLSGPLLRVRLFRRSERDQVFLIALHHIVFDAWSLWLLWDEFRQLYAQHTGGPVAFLPSLTKTYSDFVQSQDDLLRSPRGEALWRYWQGRLSGELPSLTLPTDHPRSTTPRFLGG